MEPRTPGAARVRRGAHRIDATYDRTLGFPSRVFIDYSEQVADEEFGYEV